MFLEAFYGTNFLLLGAFFYLLEAPLCWGLTFAKCFLCDRWRGRACTRRSKDWCGKEDGACVVCGRLLVVLLVCVVVRVVRCVSSLVAPWLRPRPIGLNEQGPADARKIWPHVHIRPNPGWSNRSVSPLLVVQHMDSLPKSESWIKWSCSFYVGGRRYSNWENMNKLVA